ncbi:hypothetical protein MYCTH_2302962 [Thermothelomyces thermophilus ATCC 42464]|uniref:F-box domain-containing protein n=1 Tax=Thermothelomyces thermophilus (strain ATCC 42464 / BCRC 31852 / DSM 1799) TaxID=573729 RepID=G2Q8Z3_THET4|nr:uncharacterized protein MYCTH_2302962 [Thermothelomyces thermophilus ATCC 42464]AEO57137.1 hypothetical protein MYCTH_2302962 [Thermothelomyces thermophilus ATCC 42464]
MSVQGTTVGALPPELLRQVFDALDHAAPSEHRLNDQPDCRMLCDPNCPLKKASLVNRKWRAVVLPLLFRHVVWRLASCDQLLSRPNEISESQSDDPSESISILAFLRANNLARHVRSLTIVVCREEALPSATTTDRRSGSRISSSLEEWKQARWNSISDTHAQYAAQISSATVYNGDNNWLWRMLFGIMNPLRLTLIASPQTLARLLSCMVYVGDADFFSTEERLHILSLSMDGSSRSSPPPLLVRSEGARPAAPTASRKCSTERDYVRTELFTIRPWTHLLLNENSSIRVYRTYHFFDRRPPSILGSLLGCEEAPLNVMMVPPTVTSLSYIAIFPVATHFRMLVDRLPRIDSLYLQLVPRNDILLDEKEMDHVNASDLWLERNSCYKLAMQNMLLSAAAPLPPNNVNDNNTNVADDHDQDSEVDASHTGPHEHVIMEEGPAQGGVHNWQYLRRFETGDSSDREAWLDAVEWVEESQTGWHVEAEGVLVREPGSDGARGS